jgi:2-polyprenyl-3-methyl-5-hydroxy-6-metoxy-1,4-benzoquinol methylase
VPTSSPPSPSIFSRPWYNEFFRRAEDSPTHAEFCQRVYGKNLCQHGMMDIQELDFLISLIEPGKRILEVGCGNGHISEYIHQSVKAAHLLAIDFSDVAIAQAQARTQDQTDSLQFACLDLTQDEIPGKDYDVVISVDSIYFLGEFKDSLPRFYSLLAPGGKLIVSAFEYQREEDPPEVLLPENTYMARALQALSYDYAQYDFSQNMINHWLKNYQVSLELEEAFAQEGNRFLFEARQAENVEMQDAAERGVLARYLYVIKNR